MLARPCFSIFGLFFFVLLMLALPDAAGAQDRWPPWQSYGEAENAARKKPARKRPAPDLATLNQQIVQLKAEGKFEQAIPLARRAVALAERKGKESLDVAAALEQLADLYEAQDKYADAEPLLKRALAIRQKAPGEPGVAATRERLAVAYDKQRKTDAAKATRGTPPEAAYNRRADDSSRPDFDTFRKSLEGGRGAKQHAPPKAARRYEAPSPPAAEPRVRTEPPPAAAAPPPAAMPPPLGAAPPPTISRAPVPPPPPPEAEYSTEEMTPGAGEPAEVLPEPPPVADYGPPPVGGAAPPPDMSLGQGAPAPAPAAVEEPDWQVVPVFWGTDRAVQPNAQRLVFGSDRARKLQVGEAMVTVPKVHEVPNVERPWVVKIPYFDVTIYAEKEDPKRHFTIEEIRELTREELLAKVRERLAGSAAFKDQAIVFVHGYNTSFDNALYRTAQIAYDLDFDGAAFLYSWPSGGAVASYTYDRESAQASTPYMRQFLEMVAAQTGAKQVSIIAHSMGNQPLMEVLRDMKNSAPEGVTISQVILAAPDVDADGFTNLARAIEGLAKNVTLYVAANDRALIVSRNFWGSYRAGDVPPAGPLVIPGIDTIDVTAASTDAFAINHSGYASNNKLLEDIGELLRTGLRPPEMRGLRPAKVTTSTGDYWRFAPVSASP